MRNQQPPTLSAPTLARLAMLLLLLLGAALVATLGLSQSCGSVHAQTANPSLGESCGITVALVLDSSDSILEGSELDAVREAGGVFAQAFLPTTPTLIGVIDFDTPWSAR